MRQAAIPLMTLLLLSVASAPSGAQVSPGPLARAHAQLEGASHCFDCHVQGGKGGRAAMDARCLDCHRAVAWSHARQRGLHARLKDACARCHPDHAGRDFALIVWDEGAPEKFDHRRAGWQLEGRHAKVACRDCHKPAFQRSGAGALIREARRPTSWLGLDTACASCHQDPHGGRLDPGCVSCHTTDAWKPAPRFDHAKTAYPLTGRHAQVACAKCHATEALATTRDAAGAPVPVYKPVPHADCASCHRDPHAGRFAGACGRCHVSTVDFRQLQAGSFDHDRTRYPLRGRHAQVACAKCHDPRAGGREKPGFASCGGCHADAHGGQATIAGAAQDCAACHAVQGWRPSTFTVARHATTKYPLEGAHAGVECARCHAKAAESQAKMLGPARVPIHLKHERCTTCHSDPHGGRFAPGGARARAKDCLECHSMQTWKPSLFGAAAHAQAGFALAGAHGAVPCQACHATLRAAAGSGARRALPFDDAKRACADCHRNPHGDQFAHHTDKGACDGCHGVESYTPAVKFVHNRDSAFKLDGAHARVACVACHPKRMTANGAQVLYRPIPSRCESCHVPRSQEAGRDPTRR